MVYLFLLSILFCFCFFISLLFQAANELAEVGLGEFEDLLAMLCVKRLCFANNAAASLVLLR